MRVLEFKARVVPAQAAAINEAIRTAQFVRNKCLRLWMDEKGKNKYDLNKYCKVLAREFEWAKKLNSQARQASAEQAWSAISNFYATSRRWRERNCTKGIRPVGYPKFKKHARSVEYKTSGWKLLGLKRIQFTDGFQIGVVRLIGTYDLGFYQPEQIKRVRIVRRADGYYVQFVVSVDESIALDTRQPTGQAVGLDVGLEHFYTDSNGHHEPIQQFYKKSQVRRRRLQRRLSRKAKGSKNRVKARQRLARHELKVSRQRKEHAKRLA
ncbi:RNA-guided endonuclease InsQ/TnpB family protein, partial [Thermostichus vulcanus]